MADDTGAPAPELTVTEVVAAPPPTKKPGIGFKPKTPLQGATLVNLRQNKFGTAAPKPFVQTKKVQDAPPLSTAVPLVVPKPTAKKTVAFKAPELPSTSNVISTSNAAMTQAEMEALASGAPGEEDKGDAEAGVVVAEEEVADTSEIKAAEAEAAAFKQSLKVGRTLASKPPPATAPIISHTDFGQPIFMAPKKALSGPNPVEQPDPIAQPELVDSTVNKKVKKIIYTPITSSTFSNFMVQAYKQYSPMLLRILKEGPDVLKEPKKTDPNACSNRDPNKVENFYYQKLVRDYLSRDTPYRGLLVYHGLGSGKTCTSIAAAEALYWGGKKTIYVLTPATLSNNYRRELGKCGYYPLRQNNYWTFVKLDPSVKPKVDKGGKITMADPAFIWATEGGLGLPASIVISQGGFWFPDPYKKNDTGNGSNVVDDGGKSKEQGNWSSLSDDARESIRAQQRAHLNHRFKFIHYNGVMPNVLSQLAMDGIAEGKSMFDDAVVILDEIHNLVRTINGTQIGGKPISRVIQTSEPREFTWSAPIGRERPGFRYPRGYTLYRLLQNAVGAKIIALSATPMINYAQEMAILMNMIGGEQRVVEIPLKTMNKGVAMEAIEAWAQKNPEIDFYSVEQAMDKSTVLTVAPVPFGFVKVVNSADYATRGFVRVEAERDVTKSRERNMDLWAVSLLRSLEAAGILPETATAAEAAVAAARAKGPGSPIATTAFRLMTYPMMPDDANEFVDNFVDRSSLKILNGDVLRARCSGLVSYYRGGSEDLMPREIANEIVEVPMSDYMFKEYTRARAAELEMEGVGEPEEAADAGAQKKVKGVSKAEQDLYAQATKTQQTGFLALSRAACNWVFPQEVPRPKISVKQQTKLLGIEPERTVAADLAVDVDADLDVAPATSSTSNVAGGEEGGAEATEAILKDEPEVVAKPTALDDTLEEIIGTLMSGLKANAGDYLNKALATFSPKYAAMMEKIRAAPGPVLVYSQFKTLEGLGIFAAALRAADEQFLPLDIQKDSEGDWVIPEPLTDDAVLGRPRYIMYTGDQELEKRRLLLQLYNADTGGLPTKLKGQCEKLLAGARDNRDGRICKVFMITQSGAEGISLFNTRAVLIMEPYWNNVRLQQVIGRAIRLCSHMNLPYDERTVAVYTFLSTFTDEQKATGAKQVMMADKQMTTDQVIYSIAQNKQKLADGLMEIAQSAAIDCELHFHEHGGVTKCFKYADKGRPLFMYHPDWHRDMLAQAAMRSAPV